MLEAVTVLTVLAVTAPKRPFFSSLIPDVKKRVVVGWSWVTLPLPNRMAQRPPFEPLLTGSRIQCRVPRRTLSPHTAQHFPINFRLSSVTISAEYLEIF